MEPNNSEAGEKLVEFSRRLNSKINRGMEAIVEEASFNFCIIERTTVANIKQVVLFVISIVPPVTP